MVDTANVLWQPFPGAQTDALAAQEFEVLAGGAKGGGKSDCIMFGALRQVHRAAYKALILRETYIELEELIARTHRIWPRLPQKPSWNAEFHRWDFPTGAKIKFGHCQRMKDVEKYQGGEWAYIGFDELGNVAEERIWIDLLKEIRCPDPAVKLMARATANPGYAGHGWNKRRFIRATNNGRDVHVFELELPNGLRLRQTRRYVPMRITDNPVYANDANYLATLYSLPLARRQQLLEGNWDAGFGMALPELDPGVHIIRPFSVPRHWIRAASFDWGFAHWWVFIWAAVNEDGTIFVLDTIKGRMELPDVIGESVKALAPLGQILYAAAGHDAWNVVKARGEFGPTIAERLMNDYGIPLVKANIDPIHGLNNLRDYTGYLRRGPGDTDIKPALLFFDTPGNRWLVEQCEAMVTDPDNPEKVLKVNADAETGEGGDDGFQCLQYLVASRPPRAPSLLLLEPVRAFSEATLAYEAEQSRLVTPRPVLPEFDEVIHPELGSVL